METKRYEDLVYLMANQESTSYHAQEKIDVNDIDKEKEKFVELLYHGLDTINNMHVALNKDLLELANFIDPGNRQSIRYVPCNSLSEMRTLIQTTFSIFLKVHEALFSPVNLNPVISYITSTILPYKFRAYHIFSKSQITANDFEENYISFIMSMMFVVTTDHKYIAASVYLFWKLLNSDISEDSEKDFNLLELLIRVVCKYHGVNKDKVEEYIVPLKSGNIDFLSVINGITSNFAYDLPEKINKASLVTDNYDKEPMSIELKNGMIVLGDKGFGDLNDKIMIEYFLEMIDDIREDNYEMTFAPANYCKKRNIQYDATQTPKSADPEINNKDEFDGFDFNLSDRAKAYLRLSKNLKLCQIKINGKTRWFGRLNESGKIYILAQAKYRGRASSFIYGISGRYPYPYKGQTITVFSTHIPKDFDYEIV